MIPPVWKLWPCHSQLTTCKQQCLDFREPLHQMVGYATKTLSWILRVTSIIEAMVDVEV